MTYLIWYRHFQLKQFIISPSLALFMGADLPFSNFMCVLLRVNTSFCGSDRLICSFHSIKDFDPLFMEQTPASST